MNSLSIKTKTLVMITSIIVTMSIIIASISIYEMKALSEVEVKEFKKSAYSSKEAELRNYVQIVKNIAVDYYKEYGDKGKEKALQKIQNVRYGKSGYYWIHDQNGVMIMHPIKPALNGKNLLKIQDKQGKYFFQEMNDVVRDKGKGKVSYMWPKPNEPEPKEKFSHVELFEPWGWIIGTGAYVDEIEKTVDIMHKDAAQYISDTIFFIAGLTLAIIILSYIIVSYAFNYVIKKPIEEFKSYFQNFLEFISLKSNRFEFREIEKSDELSDLQKMINTTAEAFDKKLKSDMKVMGEVVLTADKVEQGIYKCRIRSTTENPMIMTLRNTLNKMLDVLENNMVSIQTTLDEYVHSDYRRRVEISSKLKAEMLAVMNGVNALGEALGESAKTNLENGQILESNSNTMTTSMDNLSAKANEQAASLEETAAAVEEITSITRNNAANATKMADLGTTVKSAVSTGQELASKTASSMDEINTEVNAINESITIIDQIAFQTNILSLNAAVEAATAGEAGKGFAVVAQEVRNLASRSAEAAKEIKDIVESAKDKANEGKNISDEMIKGYEQLNSHITETITIIGDVSAASKEQMTGIEQINDTVTMLDRVTQENASEAGQVNEIAVQVADLAKDLVDDAKAKEFIGKNEVTQKRVEISKSQTNYTQKNTPKKVQQKAVKTEPRKTAPTRSHSSDDEWESF